MSTRDVLRTRQYFSGVTQTQAVYRDRITQDSNNMTPSGVDLTKHGRFNLVRGECVHAKLNWKSGYGVIHTSADPNGPFVS